MPKIFISYRRDDSRKDSGRIYDRLILAFGKDNVFKDIDDIPPGSDFRQVIQEEMSLCDTALVIIGQKWLNITDKAGNRRLDNPTDFVRIEVETALANPNIRVIPVLVDNARMPAESELLTSLQNLVYRNAVVVRDDPDFHTDVTRLIASLKTLEDQKNLRLEEEIAARELQKQAILKAPKEEQLSLPQEAIKRGSTPQNMRIITGSLALLLAIAGIIFLLNILSRNGDQENGNQATQEVTEIADVGTQTQAPPSGTPSPTTALSATPEPTETPSITSEPARTETPSLTPTNTLRPTDTSIPTTIPVLSEQDRAVQLALAGVASNAEWTPYSEIINSVDMVLVPAGCFMMGSTDEQIEYAVLIGANRDATLDEQPAHQQCFDEPFWIDKTEVSRAMYNECVSAGVCAARSANIYSNRDTHPINYTDWFMAYDYCNWRNARLPDEKEWEYAARGPNNLIFPWGDEMAAENVVYKANSGNQAEDTNSRPSGSSWVGALNMSGNVWEWVSTTYNEKYPYSVNWEKSEDFMGARIIRGGAFYNSEDDIRTTVRLRSDPNLDLEVIGFRCARDFE